MSETGISKYLFHFCSSGFGLGGALKSMGKGLDKSWVYSIEHYGIYARWLTVKLIILKEENLEFLDIFF